jgi:hypothetical protein
MTEGAIGMFGAAFGLSLAYNLVPGPVTVEPLGEEASTTRTETPVATIGHPRTVRPHHPADRGVHHAWFA